MIRTLIANYHTIVRKGIVQLLAGTHDIHVEGEAADGEQVLALLKKGHFNLLLIDIAIPGGDIDLIRHIQRQWPNVPILVLSAHSEVDIVTRSLKSGAAGFITKSCEPETLFSAIRKVAAGGRFIDPSLVDSMLFETDKGEETLSILSDREFEVLRKLALGLSINDIAQNTFLSPKTVSSHKTRLMKKLGIDNNAALIRFAMRHRLIPD